MEGPIVSTSSSPDDPESEFYRLKSQNLAHIDENLLPLSKDIEQRLQILTRIADVLGIDDVSFASYSAAITRLSSNTLSLKRSLNRLEGVEYELRAHLASARHEERLIRKWTEILQSDQETGESSATLERRREALLKKAKEYRKELDDLVAAMPEDPPVTITDLTSQQDKNNSKAQELKAKRNKVKAFQGLPPNLELARHELRNARNEQMKLIQLRERLLGRMAEGVA